MLVSGLTGSKRPLLHAECKRSSLIAILIIGAGRTPPPTAEQWFLKSCMLTSICPHYLSSFLTSATERNTHKINFAKLSLLTLIPPLVLPFSSSLCQCLIIASDVQACFSSFPWLELSLAAYHTVKIEFKT